MFGKRSDGRKLKEIPPFFRVIPNVMLERSDSQVYFKQDIPIKSLDEYIDKKAEEGIKLSYMYIIYAAIIRIIAERPQLNRFAMNGSLYARYGIYVSLAIKKNLSDDGQETTLKLRFTGEENIFEVKEKLDAAIDLNRDHETVNSTDSLASALSLVSNGMIRKAFKFLAFLDKHNSMPKKVIEASPFHTSVFLTNVGSLGIDSIYHHLYNFGTTSMFFAMGKKKKTFIYEDDEIHEERAITLAFVGDERICDGYYYANALKQFNRYMKKPEMLEENIIPKEDIR